MAAQVNGERFEAVSFNVTVTLAKRVVWTAIQLTI